MIGDYCVGFWLLQLQLLFLLPLHRLTSVSFTNVIIHIHSYRDYSALHFQAEISWDRSETSDKLTWEVGYEPSKSILRIQGWMEVDNDSHLLRENNEPPRRKWNSCKPQNFSDTSLDPWYSMHPSSQVQSWFQAWVLLWEFQALWWQRGYSWKCWLWSSVF